MMHSHLSQREREVIKLAITGHRDPEIALDLNVSVTTIRTYWQRIRYKLRCANKSEILQAFILSDRQPSEGGDELQLYLDLARKHRTGELAFENGEWVVALAGESFSLLFGAFAFDIVGKPLRSLVPTEKMLILEDLLATVNETGSAFAYWPLASTQNEAKYYLIMFSDVGERGKKVRLSLTPKGAHSS